MAVNWRYIVFTCLRVLVASSTVLALITADTRWLTAAGIFAALAGAFDPVFFKKRYQ